MKKIFGIFYILILTSLLSACGGPSFDGSRTGNDSQFVMKYEIFNTTDGQRLLLEAGDILRAEFVVDSGALSVKIQKDTDIPIYESSNIAASDNFDVAIEESGTYTITVTGKKAKGSVSFQKLAGEKDKEGEEIRWETNARAIDLAEAFQGINGCAVIYSPVQMQYSFYNEAMCRQQESPYSTFKIVSALSGLQNGIIADEASTVGYDGTVYSNPDWNGDLTLEEAFQKSCIWYFREIMDAVGSEKIQEELQALQYGNCDISEWNGSHINPMEKLNGFWLGASLKISPLEQVKVLERIFEGQSHYDDSNKEILKRIMLVDENDMRKIYGKTGSSGNGEAWFVGFSEADEERKYFAVYLDDYAQRERVFGSKAREIALEIME